jgi:hypothetical protein
MQSSEEKYTNYAKYLSNSVTITKKNVVPTVFKRYYSWLTNSMNLYNSTIGAVVSMFSIFGVSEVDPHEPTSRDIYVKMLESIAYGIIKSSSNKESLNLEEYINYQIEALETLFHKTADKNNKDMIEAYTNLFHILDSDNDNKLGIRDLTISLAYIDMQDGILNGKFRYEDAINMGQDINSEVGRFKMRLELNNLKALLYD